MADRADITPRVETTGSATSFGHSITTESTAGYLVRVTNGVTAPTTGCLVTVYEKKGLADRVKLWAVRAGVDSDGMYEWPVEIDPASNGIEVDFGATDQLVTKELDGTTVTF